jgi:uracil-DNA glycosylase family 4
VHALQESLHLLSQEITNCEKCPRLRDHCKAVAKAKRKSFMADTYWGKPISGYGDPNAKIVIVGLAPAAHGANRTGRIFTGDRSGDWLYKALFDSGLANQPHSSGVNDGLVLNDCFITCTVKCAPPGNMPTRQEEDHCSTYLKQEVALFKDARVWIALGQLAFRNIWPLIGSGRRPAFGHGVSTPLTQSRTLILSYHPSQQNTFTGRLTRPMFDQIFSMAKAASETDKRKSHAQI